MKREPSGHLRLWSANFTLEIKNKVSFKINFYSKFWRHFFFHTHPPDFINLCGIRCLQCVGKGFEVGHLIFLIIFFLYVEAAQEWMTEKKETGISLDSTFIPQVNNYFVEWIVLPDPGESCQLSREILRVLSKSFFLVPRSPSFQACADCTFGLGDSYFFIFDFMFIFFFMLLFFIILFLIQSTYI